MKKIILIDGNSILNRAFYGIMGTKMLTTDDGKNTNAVYGFLAVLFRELEEMSPEYLVVAFDLKAPTQRHKLYEGYKANRKGMPNELAEQMPILKEILEIMNITVIEKEGYEADDILGTIAKMAEKQKLEVIILSGDRDTFQLTSSKIKVKIPHTKVGKTEVDIFDRDAIVKKYGVTPKQLIEVKGLMGDSSDNIPGVPGIGEKTALELVKKYKTIDGLYETIEKNEDDLKPKTKEKLIENKELAYLSRTLGTINTEVPIEKSIEEFEVKKWDNEKLFSIFKELNFNRFIERFELKSQEEENKNRDELIEVEEILQKEKIKELIKIAKEQKKLTIFFGKKQLQNNKYIINKKVETIYINQNGKIYEMKVENDEFIKLLKPVLEDKKIKKYGYHFNEDCVILKQEGIDLDGLYFDVEIAAYNLNPSNNHYSLEKLAEQYLNIHMKQYLDDLGANKPKVEQISLFEQNDDKEKNIERAKNGLNIYIISKLEKILQKKLEDENALKLFKEIEMPIVKILADMQYQGIMVDPEELISYGQKLKEEIEIIKKEIYSYSGEEFNINSTQQLGVILFEKLKLPVYKKTKRGYATDVDVLEKLKSQHPIIEKILEYRKIVKLNSTFIEGLLVFIKENTSKIHSYFHQTITATGRISSAEPNLQNIPTRQEQGKQIRKAFKARDGKIFIDADYSQIELRVLAHISKDKNMKEAFLNGEDVHKQVASKVFNVPLEEVTKQQRTAAKAVNFGIVYGISSFGLAEQLGIGKKEAEQYIEQYLEKYKGVKRFMEKIVEEAKEKGYVETIFHRRRYIPELRSNNFMVRRFGERIAMNTPIQGTAADIMKIAMIEVFEKLEEEKLDAKIILQVHDELLIECKIEEKEKVKEILKNSMQNAVKLSIPLEVEVSEASNWYDVK